VFLINVGITTKIDSITVRNGGNSSFGAGISNEGILTLTNSTVSGNSSEYAGGGIFNDVRGAMTLINSTVSGNSAAQSGGGIENGGTMTLSTSSLSGNYGAHSGGGIFNYGRLALTNSLISSNHTGSTGPIINFSGSGGGIFNYGTITVTGSTFLGNVANAGEGGGIADYGTITVIGSTLSGNIAMGSAGGGIANFRTTTVTGSTLSGNSGDTGGGVFNEGSISLTDSTLSGNLGSSGGGGIYNSGGKVAINFSTVWNNTATIPTPKPGGDSRIYSGIFNGSPQTGPGPITANNSIIGDIGDSAGSNCEGVLISGLGVNFDTDGGCGSNFTQVTSAQLSLGPLALNPPGATQTQALLAGSVAIDAVSDCTDVNKNRVTTDQRGVPRPDSGEGVCDVGAYEYQEFAGTPGESNCTSETVSALSNQYGTLTLAATALKFPSVKALQAAIAAYCASTCADGIKDGLETDIDCGGPCSACASGEKCVANADCASGLCDSTFKTCSWPAPTCTDGIKDGLETDIDCGGPSCPACTNGKICLSNTDCASSLCDPASMTCSSSASTCSDGIKNGLESDIDCGGPSCPACLSGKTCVGNTDCASGLCDPTSMTCS
jgi:hypothetical protein